MVKTIKLHWKGEYHSFRTIDHFAQTLVYQNRLRSNNKHNKPSITIPKIINWVVSAVKIWVLKFMALRHWLLAKVY